MKKGWMILSVISALISGMLIYEGAVLFLRYMDRRMGLLVAVSGAAVAVLFVFCIFESFCKSIWNKSTADEDGMWSPDKDGESKSVDSFSSYREYLASITDFDVETLYEQLESYRGIAESAGELKTLHGECKAYIYSVYGFQEDAEIDAEIDSIENSGADSKTEEQDDTQEIADEKTEESIQEVAEGAAKENEEDVEGAYQVAAFDEIDITIEAPYKDVVIKDNERSKVSDYFDDTLKVTFANGITDKLEVSWQSTEDILETDGEEYIYNLVLPEGYSLSKELQKEIEAGTKFLPKVRVEVQSIGLFSISARGYLGTTPLLMQDGTGNQYWWLFVKVVNPTVTPTLAFRITGASTTKFVTMNSGSWTKNGVTYNYAYPIPVIDNNYGNYTYNVSVEGGYIGAKTFYFGSTRIDSNNYWY